MANPTYEPVAVTDLLLDAENPRIDTTDGASQRECVNRMLDWDDRKIYELAKHIVKFGGTNPSELPIVMAKGKQFLVLEGNRRLTALKLLATPTLSDDPAIVKRMQELADEVADDLPDTLLCHVVQSREEARPWIEIRHTGEKDGAGVVPWNSYMREKWEQAQGHDSKALLFAEMAAAIGKGDDDFEQELRGVIDNRFTNLTRVASDPAVRSAVGVEIKDGKVFLRMKEDRVRKAVKRLIRELNSDSGKVGNVYKKEDRQALLNQISRDLPDPAKDGLKKPVEIEGAEVPPANPKKPTPKPKPKPAKPKVLKGLTLTTSEHRLVAIQYELERLDLEKFPNSAAVLSRVFIELMVDSAIASNGWRQDTKLAKRIKTCLHHLDSTGKDKRFKGVRTGLDDGNSLMAVSTLNAFVHNSDYNPTTTNVVNIAENYREFLVALDEKLPQPD